MARSASPKFCECGCGKPTPIAARTDSAKGWRKGEPLRYLRGHQGRKVIVQPGDRFGRLLVADSYSPGMKSVPCECECGNKVSPLLCNLRTGNSQSCGCLASERTSERNRRDTPPPTVEDRGFETPCLIWQGGHTNGYGSTGNGEYAHRVAFEESCGTIPAGYHVHHRCEEPECVNPDHLEALTPHEHRRIHAERARVVA